MALCGHPENMYALRVSGWVKPNVYSCVHGEWTGKGQSIYTVQSFQGENF